MPSPPSTRDAYCQIQGSAAPTGRPRPSVDRAKSSPRWLVRLARRAAGGSHCVRPSVRPPPPGRDTHRAGWHRGDVGFSADDAARRRRIDRSLARNRFHYRFYVFADLTMSIAARLVRWLAGWRPGGPPVCRGLGGLSRYNDRSTTMPRPWPTRRGCSAVMSLSMLTDDGRADRPTDRPPALAPLVNTYIHSSVATSLSSSTTCKPDNSPRTDCCRRWLVRQRGWPLQHYIRSLVAALPRCANSLSDTTSCLKKLFIFVFVRTSSNFHKF